MSGAVAAGMPATGAATGRPASRISPLSTSRGCRIPMADAELDTSASSEDGHDGVEPYALLRRNRGDLSDGDHVRVLAPGPREQSRSTIGENARSDLATRHRFAFPFDPIQPDLHCRILARDMRDESVQGLFRRGQPPSTGWPNGTSGRRCAGSPVGI